jgi:hypothetical protein
VGVAMDAHNDEQDAIVIQLEGHKRWRLPQRLRPTSRTQPPEIAHELRARQRAWEGRASAVTCTVPAAGCSWKLWPKVAVLSMIGEQLQFGKVRTAAVAQCSRAAGRGASERKRLASQRLARDHTCKRKSVHAHARVPPAPSPPPPPPHTHEHTHTHGICELGELRAPQHANRSLESSKLGKPHMDVTLAPGDVLYVPRG